MDKGATSWSVTARIAPMILVAKPSWCQQLWSWLLDVAHQAETSTAAVRRVHGALLNSIKGGVESGRQMMQEVVQPCTELQLDIDLAFPTILMPSWQLSPMFPLEAGKMESASASVAVIECGRKHFATAKPSISDCRRREMAYQMQLFDLNLPFCAAQEMEGAAQDLSSLFFLRAHRRGIIENSFSAVVDVKLTSPEDANGETTVGNGEGEGEGVESVLRVMAVKMVVEPLAVCAAICTEHTSAFNRRTHATWYLDRCGSLKMKFCTPQQSQTPFPGYSKKGRSRVGSVRGCKEDPAAVNGRQQTSGEGSMKRRQHSLGRQRGLKRATPIILGPGPPLPDTSSGSDRKHPARTCFELVLQCSSIALSLITDMSLEADAREREPQESKKEAPGCSGASERGQHVLKLMLSGLDLAAQRPQGESFAVGKLNEAQLLLQQLGRDGSVASRCLCSSQRESRGQRRLYHIAAQLESAFRLIDTDSDGLIAQEQVQQVLHWIGLRVSPGQLQLLHANCQILGDALDVSVLRMRPPRASYFDRVLRVYLPADAQACEALKNEEVALRARGQHRSADACRRMYRNFVCFCKARTSTSTTGGIALQGVVVADERIMVIGPALSDLQQQMTLKEVKSVVLAPSTGDRPGTGLSLTVTSRFNNTLCADCVGDDEGEGQRLMQCILAFKQPSGS